jgi:hypothetical protein
MRRIFMWSVWLVVSAAACTKHNPDVCCVTAEQCDRLGLDEMFSCDSARVCNPGGICVPPQCSTSADCSSLDAPVCIDRLCVAACVTNDDCSGAAGPLCAPDGACVNCIDNSQCTTDSPTCDGTTRTCRKCQLDSECASGVCLESGGTCAESNRIIYVRSDGTDSGNCDASAPCLTIQYAFTKFSAQRNVIRIPNGNYSVGDNMVDLSTHTGFIDGANTEITRRMSGPIFTMSLGSMTLSGVNLNAGLGLALTVTGGAIYMVDSRTTGMTVNAGVLEVSRLKGGGVGCFANGTLTVRDSEIDGANGTDCTLTVQRNRLRTVGANGAGLLLIENNIVSTNGPLEDGPILNGAAGSTFRFNTVVNTSGVDQGATNLSCSAGVSASSNIIAWHTSASTQCASRYTLFDTVAGTQSGTGNKTADLAAIFVNVGAKDFHLAPNSPAKGAAEPGLNVMTDIDGATRPQPSGAAADVGAYEAP